MHSPTDLHTAVMLSAWASIALENLRLAENVERLAVTDDLTQVYNYRFLKTALRREIERAGRFRQNSVAGDDRRGQSEELQRPSRAHARQSPAQGNRRRCSRPQVRSFDLVAKYGGDEFTLILPQTEREGAMIVGERVRVAVRGVTPSRSPRPARSPSASASPSSRRTPRTAADLIQASDRALYQAKQQGRNRVETIEDKAA